MCVTLALAEKAAKKPNPEMRSRLSTGAIKYITSTIASAPLPAPNRSKKYNRLMRSLNFISAMPMQLAPKKNGTNKIK